MTNVQDLTPEMVIQAYEASRGIRTKALRFLKEKHGININMYALETRIEMWGLADVIRNIQIDTVDEVMSVMVTKALAGEAASLTWILNRYAKYSSFLDGGEDKSNEDKGQIAQIIEKMAKDNA